MFVVYGLLAYLVLMLAAAAVILRPMARRDATPLPAQEAGASA